MAVSTLRTYADNTGRRLQCFCTYIQNIQEMKNVIFKTGNAAADHSGAMESRDHSKNGASLKSHTSRVNFQKNTICVL